MDIERVVQRGYCTGCGLCAGMDSGGEIQMGLAPNGQMRPQVVRPPKAVAQRILEDACPGMRLQPVSSLPSGSHTVWGPIVECRTGHATDPQVRRSGSSGGMVSAMAIWLLRTGQVDFVAQVAASDEDPLRNDLKISRNPEDVIAAAGSRYAPSSPLASIDALLATGQKFAFVGKPCDVAALRRYGLHDQRVQQQVVCMLSFMCAGVPSMAGTHALLKKLGTSADQVKTFRYRGDGWPGMAKAVLHDGRALETDYNASWGTVLNRHLQFRCKICPDGTGELADIVAADAWYGKDGYPDFTERDGRSLVLSRTDRGEQLLQRALADGDIALSPLPIEDIAQMQPYQVHRKQVVSARWLASQMRLGRAPRYRGMRIWQAARSAGKIDWLKNCLGTWRRARGDV